MKIGSYTEKKKESYLGWYILAILFGVVLSFFFFIFIKTFIVVLKLSIKHWIYASIIVILIVIFIKKLRKRKKIREINEHQYREI